MTKMQKIMLNAKYTMIVVKISTTCHLEKVELNDKLKKEFAMKKSSPKYQNMLKQEHVYSISKWRKCSQYYYK